MINLEKALKITGWMSEPELTWLAEQASQHHNIVEIGCWQGRTTRAIADNTTGQVWAVDTFEGSAENQDELKDKPHGYLFQEFFKNLRDHIGNLHVVPWRGTSLEAAKNFASKERFDMVFIDASHDYENVKADILAWRELVTPGGLLCGHDYDWGFPGVVHAVRELISPVPNQAANGSSIWYATV